MIKEFAWPSTRKKVSVNNLSDLSITLNWKLLVEVKRTAAYVHKLI